MLSLYSLTEFREVLASRASSVKARGRWMGGAYWAHKETSLTMQRYSVQIQSHRAQREKKIVWFFFFFIVFPIMQVPVKAAVQ